MSSTRNDANFNASSVFDDDSLSTVMRQSGNFISGNSASASAIGAIGVNGGINVPVAPGGGISRVANAKNANKSKIRPYTTTDLLFGSSQHVGGAGGGGSGGAFAFDDQSDSSSECSSHKDKSSNSRNNIGYNNSRDSSSNGNLEYFDHNYNDGSFIDSDKLLQSSKKKGLGQSEVYRIYPSIANRRLGSPSRSRSMAASLVDNIAISSVNMNSSQINNSLIVLDSNNSSIIAANNKHATVIRPRAPRSKCKSLGDGESALSVENSKAATTEKTNQKSQSRKPKAQNISELLDNLQHFNKTNMGRSLNKNEQDEIHYVNLGSKKVDKKPTEVDGDGEKAAATAVFDDSDSSAYLFKSSSRRIRKQPIGTNPELASFSIPELPSGRSLTLNILSTWGDPHYVGLMGIEIFDRSGHLVKISYPEKQIWADPPDINILPENVHDPRTVDNLLDGINLTCDDLHAWLAPFTSGNNHFVFIEFDEITTISMIRIWNYNKSRIHSHRGARYIEIMFDDRSIFKGEIKQAPGVNSIMNFDDCCECILFTRSNNILKLIERYDRVLEDYSAAIKELEQSRVAVSVHRPMLHSRTHLDYSKMGAHSASSSNSFDDISIEEDDITPPGASSSSSSSSFSHHHQQQYSDASGSAADEQRSIAFDANNSNSSSNSSNINETARPSTRAGRVSKKHDKQTERAALSSVEISKKAQTDSEGDTDLLDDSVDLTSMSLQSHKYSVTSNRSVAMKTAMRDNSRPSTAAMARRHEPCKGRVVDVCVLNTWGSEGLIGVTAFSGVDEMMEEFVLPVPKILVGELFKNDTGGYELKVNNQNAVSISQMSNTPDIIVDGHTQTSDQRDMWLAVKPQKGYIVLQFDLKRSTSIKGLKVWNFNASGEDHTSLGFKHVQLYIDGVISSTVLIRKAPGIENVDYAQFLPLVRVKDSATASLSSSLGSAGASSGGQHPLTNQTNSKSLISILEAFPSLKDKNKLQDFNNAQSETQSLNSKPSAIASYNWSINGDGTAVPFVDSSSASSSSSSSSSSLTSASVWTSHDARNLKTAFGPPGSESGSLMEQQQQQQQIPPAHVRSASRTFAAISLCPVPQQYETPVRRKI